MSAYSLFPARIKDHEYMAVSSTGGLGSMTIRLGFETDEAVPFQPKGAQRGFGVCFICTLVAQKFLTEIVSFGTPFDLLSN